MTDYLVTLSLQLRQFVLNMFVFAPSSLKTNVVDGFLSTDNVKVRQGMDHKIQENQYS